MTTSAGASRLHDEIRADLEAQGLDAFEGSTRTQHCDAIEDALHELQQFNEARFKAAHIRDVPFTHMFWQEWFDTAKQQQQQQQQEQAELEANTKSKDGCVVS